MARAWIVFIILAFAIIIADCSNGDKSLYYTKCLPKCYASNCTKEMNFKESPPIELILLFWTCEDDCRYKCMWDTVAIFEAQQSKVPQFHGKWPFRRILGLQEPASVFFSVLNFFTHFTLFRRFKRELRSSNPMYFTWSYFSLICMNGWLWSTIFHARETPWTEAMDYSCAFTIVLTSLLTILIRISRRSYKEYVFINGCYMGILYIHLSHLWSGRINYGYNMNVNVAVGISTFFVTMVWWYRNKRNLRHAAFIGWFNILTVIVTLLEVADFPPIFWIFDAHSLWHASTAPLAVLLYRFMIQDCRYLRRQDEKSLLGSK